MMVDESTDSDTDSVTRSSKKGYKNMC